MNLRKRLSDILEAGIIIGLFVIITSNYYYLNLNGVNIPVGDEWEALISTEYLRGLNWHWIFEQHNEHRIVFTKIHTYLLYVYNRWDIATQIAQNFYLYLASVIAMWFALKKGPTRNWTIIAGSSVFLFSGAIRENFTWGFQSQFHFALLFSVLSALLLTSNVLTWRKVFAASLFTACAVYSFSSALPMALSLVLIFSVYSSFCYYNSERSKQVIFKCLLYAFVVFVLFVYYFSSGYQTIAGHPKLALPIHRQFWEYLTHLVGSGFSVPAKSALGGFICAVLVLFPVSRLIFRDFLRKEILKENWTLLMLLGICFSALASIALGRAGFGVGQAYSSRYVEFSAPLIPIAAVAWHRLYPTSATIRYFLCASFLILLVFHRKQFAFSKIYSEIAKSRTRGVECLRDSIKRQNAQIICTDLYPFGDLQERVRNMKALNTSFSDGL